ncbi:MAG: DNA ligase D [bacterium]
MGLESYRRKRDFRRTPEPSGDVEAGQSLGLYVIQKHAARRLHYDFRLEMGGVLKSWAVPKGPALRKGEKRLAVHVEDHPVEYGDFEGVIPKGEYGGGTVMVWDRGRWEPEGDPEKSYRKGRLSFRLHGEKLKGKWTLVQMHGEASEGGKNWLLIKTGEDGAGPGQGQAKGKRSAPSDLSAATGRTMEEIARAADKVWHSANQSELPEASATKGMTSGPPPRPTPSPPVRPGAVRHAVERGAEPRLADPSRLPGARKARQPETFRPQLATLVQSVPQGEDWVHEIKYDGYRILCFLRAGKPELVSRNGIDWTGRFPAIAEDAARLPFRDAILDGEIVVLNPDGTTNFQALQNALKGVRSGKIVYYVFDLPHCGGYDLTRTPLTARKELLRGVLGHPDPDSSSLWYGGHVQGKGPTFFEHACRYAVEGVVSKRADSFYEQKRTRSWLKVKCLQRQELVIGGYTDPSGSRPGFGALLVGYHDRDRGLVYAGRVGTGFDDALLRQLARRLKGVETEKPPFANPPRGRDARGVHWAEPVLVAEVAFTEWTEDGVLRHPSFKGLREDKDPSEVVREAVASPGSVSGPGAGAPAATARDAVAGVKLTNPDRILYPEQGITKSDLAAYYEAVSQRILPHIRGRPLTLVRCPQGRQKKCFYQKHLDETLPEALRGVPIREKDKVETYIVLDDLSGLISLVQLGVLEIHPWGSREDRLEQPDRLVFDLDPDPAVPWQEVVRAAWEVRERLGKLGLASFAKITGGKGIHVVVPLSPRAGWEEAKAFARAVAEGMVRESPGRFVAVMSKQSRKGRIFVDYLRNSRGATSVAPYSTRARPGAPVSTPLAWEELEGEGGAAGRTVNNLPEKLSAARKDPWEGFFSVRQAITARARKTLGL